ncbi:MAG: SurA N-terminal domain-containing protein [Bacteroidales bacterium]
MATLETIRNRAGILIAIVIGLALLAFILGDLLGGGNTMFMSRQMEIGKIAGTSVSVNEYQQKIEELAEIYKLNSGQRTLDAATMEDLQDQTWNLMVQQTILNKQLEKLGLAVTPEEVFEMVQGENPHPTIRQMFTNPETGEFNKAYVLQFLKAMSQGQVGEQREFWLYLEKEIIRERKLTKYNNLIKKGMYATSLEAKNEFVNTNKKYSLGYVMRRFTEIPDSLVTVTDKDLKKYYGEHKNNYEQEASVDLEYVAFEVLPSEEDYTLAQEWINDIQDEFATARDDQQFVNLNSDVPFDNKNYKKGELPETIDEFMFTAEVGDIYGPYLENDAYKLSKLSEINFIPDSVRARHILIAPEQQDPDAMQRAVNRADSLRELISEGAGFAELARQYSDDGSAGEGGDLGWFTEGEMVQPFNDFVFNGDKGDIEVVETRFGAHVIEIIDQSAEVKKVKVATIVHNVEPSDETYQEIYSLAGEFAVNTNTAKEFDEAVDAMGVVKKYAYNLRENDRQITGLESPRELIRWAFTTAEEGDISDIYEFDNKFVIAKVAAVREEGYAPLESIRDEVRLNVIKEKKADIIAEEMNNVLANANTIDDVGQELAIPVEYVENVTFASTSISGIGAEPKILGFAEEIEINTPSSPIKGNNGVYIIQVSGVTEVKVPENLSADKRRLASRYSMRANYEAFEALREASNVIDKRSRFY